MCERICTLPIFRWPPNNKSNYDGLKCDSFATKAALFGANGTN
jgi:hypothetical protein